MPLIEYGEFVASSRRLLPWKIDCACLSDAVLAALAKIIADKITFSVVVGVPTGGDRLASHLRRYVTAGHPTLVVDDVLTTGASMERAKAALQGPVVGVVIFARYAAPAWVHPLFAAADFFQK